MTDLALAYAIKRKIAQKIKTSGIEPAKASVPSLSVAQKILQRHQKSPQEHSLELEEPLEISDESLLDIDNPDKEPSLVAKVFKNLHSKHLNAP